MQKINRNQYEPYPQFNLSTRLLKHQQEMLQFLYFTEYDIVLQAFQLKHSSYISSTKRGHPVQQFNKQEEIQRHFGIISQKLHIRLIRDDIDLDKKLDKLQLLWHSRNVPMFHRYYFQKYVYSTFVKSAQALFDAQQKLIKQDKHIFATIFKTINARQACLRQLKKNLAQLTAQDVYEYLHIARQRFFNQKKKNENQKFLKKGYQLKITSQKQSHNQQAKISKCKLQFFSDNFNHLAKLTLYTIDQIFKWKQYIFSLTHDAKKKRQRIEYYYFQQNYLLKILYDNSFIRVSFLQRFYKFAPKNDPFLLWPILAFQKKESKQLDNQFLKQIFMPQQQQLSQILNKMESLSEEYKWNIRSRKKYDANVMKKPMQIDMQKKRLDGQINQKQNVANLVLKKIQSPPRRTKSLKTFRIRDQTKQKQIVSSNKDKILIEFKKSTKKRVFALPVGQLKTSLQTEYSPLKNSVIIQRNKVNPLQSNQVSDELLKNLKQQVVRKIKQDYMVSGGNISSNSKSSKDQALQLYINTKINQAIKGIFPYQPQKQLKQPIQLTFFRIQQKKLSSQVNLMIKTTVQLYSQMQYSQTELIKKIQQSPYVYFLKATLGDQYLATLIITLDKEIQQYKALKTLYIGFNDVSQLQTLILQAAKFIQKFQNAFQMHFPFFVPLSNQPIKKLLTTLQQNLTSAKQKDTQLKCLIAQKQIYSNISQCRFIFKRQNKNTNFYPNRFPLSLHFKLALIQSEKKLFLQRSKIDKVYNKKISYDFLLSQLLRRLYQPQTVNILKQKSFSQQRFKQMIIMMMNMQNNLQKILGDKNLTKFIEGQNISQLNKQLSKRKQEYPFLQLSDTVKTQNKVNSVSMSFVLALPYHIIKTVIGKNSDFYYKISIKQQIEVINFRQTKFYKLPLIDQRINRIDENKPTPNPKHLILFSAQQYLSLGYPELTSYLIQSLIYQSYSQKNNFKSKNNNNSNNQFINQANSKTYKTCALINQIWLPMLRYPQKYQERQQLFLTTHRLNDLQQIKQELFVGQFFQWFCDMQLENGIKYHNPIENHDQKNAGQIVFQKPLGLAIVSDDLEKSTLLYGRIFTDSLR